MEERTAMESALILTCGACNILLATDLLPQKLGYSKISQAGWEKQNTK
jgi:hypothetical protein